MTSSPPYKDILDHLYDGVYFLDTHRRITYWNSGAERIAGYTSEQVIGRSCAANLLMHIDEAGTPLCKSLCPVAKTLKDGETREAQVYLHHAQGYRVPVLVHVTPIKDEQGNISGAVEVFSDNSSLLAALRRISDLNKSVVQDALTGVGSRSYIEARLQSVLSEQRQHGLASGVLFIDIDNFKKINDSHGHLVGDSVLKMVAETINHNIRETDAIGRWGGEEFLSIILNVEREQLLSIAEKLRMLVEHSFLHKEPDRVQVTISIGACLTYTGESLDSLLQRADALLYESKRLGKNRVTFAESTACNLNILPSHGS